MIDTYGFKLKIGQDKERDRVIRTQKSSNQEMNTCVCTKIL